MLFFCQNGIKLHALLFYSHLKLNLGLSFLFFKFQNSSILILMPNLFKAYLMFHG